MIQRWGQWWSWLTGRVVGGAEMVEKKLVEERFERGWDLIGLFGYSHEMVKVSAAFDGWWGRRVMGL